MLSGEGVHVGVPSVVVRTQGCNLRCWYCDTKDAQETSGGLAMDIAKIVPRVVAHKSRKGIWALITGGEPLLQPDITELVMALNRADVKVEIETNGSLSPPTWWNVVNCWSVDVKCPSSRMSDAFCRDWLGLRAIDQLKFVVGGVNDLTHVLKTIGYSGKVEAEVIISPVYPWNPIWLKECAAFCLQHHLRLSLQQHKLIYGNERGH